MTGKRQGHIERRRSEGDERKVFIHLTDTGRALKSKTPEITACIIGETGLPGVELERLIGTIGALRDSLHRTRMAGK
ncbi:MAG: hypothetical protein GY789_23530 [Hyphomicrobiales bacterium]|nr:hypothetical protein [Hyphomicrobiales bacterium]MCP4997780.1 hypothetical protein [Hyphomicrobiales bacterium]